MSTPVGAFRFNTDTSKLEYYDGNQWVNITSTSPDAQTGGTRVITAGVNTHPSWDDHMDYFNLETTGNATDFGNMPYDTFDCGVTASRTRGIILGGYHPSNGTNNNIINYVTIATTGNASDFGDLTQPRGGGCSHSDGTRAVYVGGSSHPATDVDVIDYITIASTGNAVDFGDIGGIFNNNADGGCGTPTRGVFHAREPDNAGRLYTLIMASTGNLVEFGDTVYGTNNVLSGASNAVRGIWGGAYNSNALIYADLTSFGNAVDFGDMTSARYQVGMASSPTRACMLAGAAVPGYTMKNDIEYVQIMTTGNAVDFGDLNFSGYYVGGLSNGHGGLG